MDVELVEVGGENEADCVRLVVNRWRTTRGAADVRGRYAKQQLGLQVEICTNGYRIERRLAEIASYLDFLRVSLEGIGSNDQIRRPGSYQSALAALRCARELGVRTGVTMTVTALNLDEVLPLARIVQGLGAVQLKLHCLRPVGNALRHSGLFVTDSNAYMRLREQLSGAGLDMEIILDDDLSVDRGAAACSHAGQSAEIQRIEADPRGALTMSCKAVGVDSHAFWYDKITNRIVYQPSATDELVLPVPDVVYARV